MFGIYSGSEPEPNRNRFSGSEPETEYRFGTGKPITQEPETGKTAKPEPENFRRFPVPEPESEPVRAMVPDLYEDVRGGVVIV